MIGSLHYQDFGWAVITTSKTAGNGETILKPLVNTLNGMAVSKILVVVLPQDAQQIMHCLLIRSMMPDKRQSWSLGRPRTSTWNCLTFAYQSAQDTSPGFQVVLSILNFC